MFTSGSKYYFGLSFFAFLAAVLYGASSGVHSGLISMLVGPLTFGYKGSIGDHVGYSVLMGLSLVSLFLGCVVVAFRDDDATALAQVAHTESVPEVLPPDSPSYIPIFAAFGMGTALVGLVVASPLFLLGVVILVMVTVEWAVKVWSDRATGDAAVNQRIRNRIMNPIEVPVIGAIVVAFFVLGISRILLALPEVGADVLFGVIPALILVAGVLIANRERVSKNVVVGLILFGGVAVLVGGVISASVGPRQFEKHEQKTEQGALPAHVIQRGGR